VTYHKIYKSKFLNKNMKKELKLIYDKVAKPLVKGIGVAAITPLVIPTVCRYAEEDKDNFRFSVLLETFGLISFAIPIGLLTKSIQSFSQGKIKEGLLYSIPIITNILSGAYETYRWAKNKVKAEEDGKLGNLEKALAPSRAKSIEKAVEYMVIEPDGSLHTNGNYNDEERREQYQEIVRRLPKKAVAKMMVKLTENLPSLELSEKMKPRTIKKYFGEKSGVPISNYHELDLFYQVLTEREEGKRK
jgi:hypothetical protein